MNDRQWNQGTTDGMSGEGGAPLMPSDDAPQMPLSMLTGQGGDGDLANVADPFNTSSGGKHTSPLGGLLAVVVLLTVGGGSLWAMHMHNRSGEKMDTSVAAAEKKIEEALQRVASGKTDGSSLSRGSIDELLDTDHAITLLSEDPTRRQVAVEDLAKNPFELTAAKTVKVEAPTSAALAERSRQELRRKLETELSRLKLQSVISGRQSAAVISGKVVRPGDAVGSFTVAAIGPADVELTADGQTFSLSMVLPNVQR